MVLKLFLVVPYDWVSPNLNKLEFNFTDYFLSDKNDWRSDIELFEKQYDSSLRNKISWQMELKAFARSKNIDTQCSLLSNVSTIFSTTKKTASMQDFYLWNPNCFWLIILCFSVYSESWFNKSRSNIFANIGVTDIGL